MSLTVDLKRAFRKSKYVKPIQEPRTQHPGDTTDSKARHILGLDTAHVGPGRKNSTSSTSTSKLPSVAFSDATTAAVSAGSATETLKDDPSLPDLKSKSSSVLLKRPREPEAHDVRVTPQVSNNSLRSFYDKYCAPLTVSQQTSDSASRDFALRKGVPSIISASSQEMEHSRQLRFFSKSPKKLPYDKNRLTPKDSRPATTASQSSVVSFETRSDASHSVASQRSGSRISVAKGILKSTPKSPVPAKYHVGAEDPFPVPQDTIDPARAKVNIRRPKAGAKNWFDSLDSDSSDGESTALEPQYPGDFAIHVEEAFDDKRMDRHPPRSSSKTPTSFQLSTPKTQTEPALEIPKATESRESRSKPPIPKRNRRRTVNPIVDVDLTKHSILLSSSDDETEEVQPPALTSYQELARRDIRESLMNGPWDESIIEVGQAVAVDTKEPERILERLPSNVSNKPIPGPRRSSSKPMTYLDDRSTETLGHHRDLITSFPRTPTDTPSRGTSVRESMLSESESISSTKLMTVTRQEETLIAAMRMKKTAMKRAQAAANRQHALRILELDADNMVKSHRQKEKPVGRFHSPVTPSSPLRLSYLASPSTLRHNMSRPESVTTFQTESILQPSVRDSSATYMSEGLDDFSVESSTVHRSMNHRADRAPRDTFLSERSTTTTNTDTYSDWSPSVRDSTRDSHIVVLDPLERQLMREEIPSQLFMERPFLGWEARTNMQTAH